MIDPATKSLVRNRAGNRCEYCRISQDHLPASAFHTEHVVPRQHQGSDDPGNLALSCDRCNFHKGPNLSAIDPASGDVVLLFNPRKDRWHDHFRLTQAQVVGLTAVGRATVRLLNMNAAGRVELRRDTGQS